MTVFFFPSTSQQGELELGASPRQVGSLGKDG